jgi:hypothetical protein
VVVKYDGLHGNLPLHAGASGLLFISYHDMFQGWNVPRERYNAQENVSRIARIDRAACGP